MVYRLLVWDAVKRVGLKFVWNGSYIADHMGAAAFDQNGVMLAHVSWEGWLDFIEDWRMRGFEVYTPAKVAY